MKRNLFGTTAFFFAAVFALVSMGSVPMVAAQVAPKPPAAAVKPAAKPAKPAVKPAKPVKGKQHGIPRTAAPAPAPAKQGL